MFRNEQTLIKIYFVSLVLRSVLCNDANIPPAINLNLFNWDQIKSDLSALNQLDFLNIYKLTSNEKPSSLDECSTELIAIKNGLEKSEEWALKIVDAWGKIPSGIMSGNLVDFGAFSQCFKIERHHELYKTKYCLGKLIPTTNGNIATSANSRNINPMFQAIDGFEFEINPSPSLTFGMCLPMNCPLDLLEPVINANIHTKFNSASVKLVNSTCQYHENDYELTKSDQISIGALICLLLLIILSTSYDVSMILINRDKSLVLSAFSIYSNGSKVLSYEKSKSPEMMQCLHGIRTISTQWIVLGHTVLMYMLLPTQNMIEFPMVLSEYRSMIIMSAPVAVDTFFVISGLLVSFNLLKHLEKTGTVNVPLLYFHRYLRLTPLLVASIWISAFSLRFLVNGPLYPSMIDILMQNCRPHWWSVLLYIQNYVNPNEMCFMHSWYLSVDMQLFLIAPALVYLMHRFGKKALFSSTLLILGCIGCTIAVHVEYGLTSILMTDKMAKAYFPTHIRFSSWLIGVMGGYVLFKLRNQPIQIPKIVNLLAWITSLALMVIVIFANYPLQQLDSKNTPFEFGLYDALSRVFWSISLCYVIFACVHGYGGPVNWFLSHPLWQPLSRLSYSIYLLHFPLIFVTMGTLKTSRYFSELSALHIFFGNYVLTVIVSICATLAFESPIIIIEKLLFNSNESKDTNTQGGTHFSVDPIPYEQIANEDINSDD